MWMFQGYWNTACFAHASLNTPSTKPTNQFKWFVVTVDRNSMELEFKQFKKHTVFLSGVFHCALKMVGFDWRADQNRNFMMLISNVSSAIFFIAVSLYLRSMPFFRKQLLPVRDRVVMMCREYLLWNHQSSTVTLVKCVRPHSI